MGNVNRVTLIGRLTREVETKTFQSGGKVAKIGFCVNQRVKNQSSGEWEDKPVWLDVKAFDRENGRKLATLCEDYLHKGDQVYFEGHLVLEEWEDKQSGDKRSKLVIVVDDVQFLQPKREEDGNSRSKAPAPASSGRRPANPDDVPEEDDESDIPF